MKTGEPRQIDLLAWPRLRDAEQRLAAAEDARALAQRRYQYAPHGLRESRLSALREASAEAREFKVKAFCYGAQFFLEYRSGMVAFGRGGEPEDNLS